MADSVSSVTKILLFVCTAGGETIEWPDIVSRPMLVHTVLFYLKPELTAEQREEFRRGVDTLSTIASVAKVYVGTPAKTEKRPVIDDSYGVGLTVVCANVAAHDAYQVDPIHLAFVAKYKTYWTRVQIYDFEE